MVVVGTGHCTDAAAANTDYKSSSECQLESARTQLPGSSLNSNSQSIHFTAPVLKAPQFSLLQELVGTQPATQSRAMGSSLLADRRFSGTSPPILQAR
jgi:hypothetical protein